MTSGFLLKSTDDFYMGTQSWRCHSDMGIPCNHNPNRWGKIWQGDAHITRVWEWGCPYHRDSAVTGSTQCGPGSLSPPHRRHPWAEFAVGFRALVFSSPLAFFLSSFFFFYYIVLIRVRSERPLPPAQIIVDKETPVIDFLLLKRKLTKEKSKNQETRRSVTSTLHKKTVVGR